MKLALSVAFVLGVSVSDDLYASIVTEHNLNVCNFAPYSVEVHWIVIEKRRYGKIQLGAGECSEIIVNPLSSEEVKDVRLYSKPTNSDAFHYLQISTWYGDIWNNLSHEIAWPGYQENGAMFCYSSASGNQRQVYSASECNTQNEIRLYSGKLSFDKLGRADWIILDFAICSRLTDLDCYGFTKLEDFSIWASEMNAALERLYAIENFTYGYSGLVPTHPGFEVVDNNGMFNQGVDVVATEAHTPFGTPIQLQKGDILLYFNGHKIFGRDLIKLIYDSGKQYGYNHSNEIIFMRDSVVYSTNTALYFDKKIYGTSFLNSDGTCKAPFLVASLSALNEFLFYRQVTTTCLLNGVSSGGFDSFENCKFERNQFLAANKQFCPKINYTGELVGSLTFAGRDFIENLTVNRISALKGKSLYSKISRAALVEVTEESFRAALTQPPGLKTEAIIHDIVNRGKLQGAIGVGFQVSPILTAATVAPMVYNSFKNM